GANEDALPCEEISASIRGRTLWRNPIASARATKLRSERDSTSAKRQVPWLRKSAVREPSVSSVEVSVMNTRLGSWKPAAAIFGPTQVTLRIARATSGLGNSRVSAG